MLYARDLFDWLEPALVLLALLLIALRPAALGSLAERGARGVAARLAGRSPITQVTIVVALLAALMAALISAKHGVPAPRVSDEFAYVLQADTFAQVRASMPTPPSPAHFETFFVLVEPSYASKYPPGQAVVLGFGQALAGHPVVGLWLLTGLLAAALFWGLAGFVPWPWALIATMIGLCRFGPLSYWSQSYWGGALAAIGGALLWGAIGRLRWPETGPETGPENGTGNNEGNGQENSRGIELGLTIGVGLAILANTRPFEGMIVALPAALGMLIWGVRGLRRHRLGTVLRCALAVSAVLAAAATAMIAYNRAVIGDPWRMPYQEWESQYASVPTFYGRPIATTTRPVPEQIARFYAGLAEQYDPDKRWIGAEAALDRLERGVDFYLGPALLLVVLVAPLLRGRRDAPSPGPARHAMLPIAATVLLLAVQLMLRPWWPHYTAPATFGFLLVAALGLERLWQWRPVSSDGASNGEAGGRGRRFADVGPSLVVAALAINLLYLVPQWVERDRESRSWGRDRQALIEQLNRTPGFDVIFVRYGATHHPAREWVFNEADIRSSSVVWAHDLGAARNGELIEALGPRDAWLLEVDTAPGAAPALSPYDGGRYDEGDDD